MSLSWTEPDSRCVFLPSASPYHNMEHMYNICTLHHQHHTSATPKQGSRMLHNHQHLSDINNLIPGDDMLSTCSHLWFGVSHDLAGEGDRHALEDFVVF